MLSLKTYCYKTVSVLGDDASILCCDLFPFYQVFNYKEGFFFPIECNEMERSTILV